MKLAGSSASMLALGRSGFALPVLAGLLWLERRGKFPGHWASGRPLSSRARWLARLAGLFLAADLVVWSHSIDDIGAGLGTVLSNLQLLIVSLVGWLVLGERPRRSLLVAAPVMVFGLLLVGGVLTGGGYGRDPRLGVVYGIGVAIFYSVYILLLRQAATGESSAIETLFQATVGATVGAAVLGAALRDFRLGPAWPAVGWLVVLALTSGVLGWLLLTISMPRLPAWLASSLLLVQPAGSVLLGAVFLGERPTLLQQAGVVIMLGGVLVAARGAGGARGAAVIEESAVAIEPDANING